LSGELSSAGELHASLHPGEVCETLSIAVHDRPEILRYLGYPAGAAPRPGTAERIDAIIAEALPSLRPRGFYTLYPVADQTAHSLTLSDITISGKIGEFLAEASRIAVFVVTVGEEISGLAQSASKRGDAFSAWVMDALGSWAVESAADALMVRIRRHLGHGEELTLRYSPGYCGMALAQQRSLFQLMQAWTVGVRLMPTMLMHPLKSISGVVGLSPKEAVARYRSPCDLCPSTGCHMRRAS
jgi:hypothetical protein